MAEIIISPSILSADFANLQQEIENVVTKGAKWVHIDVMDGHFVKNITIGAPVVKSIRKITSAVLDSHLMIENPQNYIPDFLQAGSDVITFHYEAAGERSTECIEMIKSGGALAGISIKPKTPVEDILPYLPFVDLVLVMTVEPGFSGQIFMPKCAQKIAQIKTYAPDIKYIQADGGINDKTGEKCKQLGANCLVAGNYIFKSKNRAGAINALLN